jgi:hypothetical protein
VNELNASCGHDEKYLEIMTVLMFGLLASITDNKEMSTILF